VDLDQVWLPRLSCQLATPATRAGTPTARQASTSRIESPVQVARPCSIDSAGDWFGFLRPVL
jgi:hypothetical protein